MGQSFREQADALLNWVEDYFARIGDYPVRAQVKPGEVLAKLPEKAPETAEDFAHILAGLKDTLPGVTHWQHPRFFAYFPGNVRPESLLAEIALAAQGANAMLWETSPAATEMEMRTTDWLRDAMGLPNNWSGVVQETASAATFAAVLTARERATGGIANREGLTGCPPLSLYVSAEAHSSIEKAARMAGLGSASVRVVDTDDRLAMDPTRLRSMIEGDIAAGRKPAALMITAGGTGTGAFDRAADLMPIAREHGLYVHVDAAWAGAVMICDEFRPLFCGVEDADSFVFNPHKWLGVGFECSVQFLKNPQEQVDAMTVKPVYLESIDGVCNYCDWSPVLGRRNRGLKLWMVLSLVGLDAIRSMIRDHIRWTADCAAALKRCDGFEVVTEPRLALFTFRYKGDAETEALLHAINADGYAYFTKTNVAGRPVIRWSIGSWRTTEEDVGATLERLQTLAFTV